MRGRLGDGGTVVSAACRKKSLHSAPTESFKIIISLIFCRYDGKNYLYYINSLFFQKKDNIYLYDGKKGYSIISDDKKKYKLYDFAAKAVILGGMSFGL